MKNMNNTNVLGCTLMSLILASLSYSQISHNSVYREFHDARNNLITAEYDSISGGLLSVGGLSANIKDYGFSTTGLNEEVADEIGRRFVHEYGFIMGIDSNQILTENIRSHNGLWFIHYYQAYHGIPIDGSLIGFFIGPKGQIEGLQGTSFQIGTLPVSPSVASSKATDIVQNDNAGIKIKFARGPDLVVSPEKESGKNTYFLAWKSFVWLMTASPKYFEYLIDAKSGRIIEKEQLGNEMIQSGEKKGKQQ